MNYSSTFKLLLLWVVHVSCGGLSDDPLADYGLLKIEIEMDSDELGELNSSTHVKRPFSARVKVNGESYKTHLHYAGKSTVDAPKKSFHIYFLEDQLFNRREMRLSAQYLDRSFLKSLLGFQLYKDNSLLSPDVEPVVLYLNKKYLGLYLMIEPVNQQFFQTRGLVTTDLYKAKFANADFTEKNLSDISNAYTFPIGGRRETFIRNFWEIVLEPSDTDLTLLSKILNIEDYLRYMAVTVVLNHMDGFDNNHFWARQSSGVFRIVPWDLDRIYEPTVRFDIFGLNGLSAKLMNHPLTRTEYLVILGEVLTLFEDARRIEILDYWQAKIAEAYSEDRFLGRRLSLEVSRQQLEDEAALWLASVVSQLEVHVLSIEGQ